MLALLLVLSVGQAEAQFYAGWRGGMADNGYWNDLSSYAKGGNKWVYGRNTCHGYRHVTIPSAQFTAEGGYYLHGEKSVLPQSGNRHWPMRR